MHPKYVTQRCKRCGREYQYAVGDSYSVIPGDFKYLCPDCLEVIKTALAMVPVKYQPELKEVEPFEITDRMNALRQQVNENPCKKCYPKIVDDKYSDCESWTLDGTRAYIKTRRDNGKKDYFKVYEKNVETDELTDKLWVDDSDDDYYVARYLHILDTKPIPMEQPIARLFFYDPSKLF